MKVVEMKMQFGARVAKDIARLVSHCLSNCLYIYLSVCLFVCLTFCCFSFWKKLSIRTSWISFIIILILKFIGIFVNILIFELLFGDLETPWLTRRNWELLCKENTKYVRSVQFVKISVADPVHFFRIRIRGSGFLNTDPDPGEPKKTGSGSYVEMFSMLSKIIIFVWLFLTKSKHLLTHKIKDKKLFGRNCSLDNFIWR